MKITIEFGIDNFPITWVVNETDIAESWYEKLKISYQSGIKENNRFYNFPGQSWSKESIVMALEDEMKVINSNIKHYFHRWPHFEMTQHDLNRLHNQFSKLRGSLEEPSMYWIDATQETKDAIEKMNILIHRLESYGNHRPRFVSTFNDEQRSYIPKEDFIHFTLINNFGDIALNYNQVGKQLLDAYRDQDTDMTEELRPMDQYGAAFTAKFYTITGSDSFELRTKIHEWYLAHQFNTKLQKSYYDTSIALGWIPVASLSMDNYAHYEIIESLGKNDIIKKINFD